MTMSDLSPVKEVQIRRFAHQIRLETLRELVGLGFGHVGGCMSICELLAVLYSGQLHAGPAEKDDPNRDRLICSKGHAGPAVYAALALRGFMPLEMLSTLNRSGTRLPSHCDRNLTPGIDMTTGSLGQGLSVGVGAALGCRLDGRESSLYVIVGDGEAQEGQIWEAAMAASQFQLSNLIVFIDHNGYQINGPISQINDISNFAQRFESFGWNTIEVDGHDVRQLHEAISEAKHSEEKPTAIIMHTVKGYGCKYALESARCHSLNMPADKLAESIALVEEEIARCDEILREGGGGKCVER